ncbi:MAG: sigma-70 family RNA polymerase sigma factor [Planctomycetes bacterium]|nr:sigma-70 family RNA polymerase sigma factor [Planctomycetota bacterium]
MGNSPRTDRIQEVSGAGRGDPDGQRATGSAEDMDAVRRCLAGESDAFGEIVARWQDRIYSAVYRMTGDADNAKDLAQETFIRAWSSLRSYHGGAAFGTWLYAIALNQVRSDVRRRRAQKRGAPISLDAQRAGTDEDRGIDPADRGPGPVDASATTEHVYILRKAVAALDPDYREVIVLREFEDLSYEEIAEATGVPVGTVRSRLFRAREELRRVLDGRVQP